MTENIVYKGSVPLIKTFLSVKIFSIFSWFSRNVEANQDWMRLSETDFLNTISEVIYSRPEGPRWRRAEDIEFYKTAGCWFLDAQNKKSVGFVPAFFWQEMFIRFELPTNISYIERYSIKYKILT